MQPKSSLTPAAIPRSVPNPIACVSIEPVGRRNKTPREYQIKLSIDLSGREPKFSDRKLVMEMVRGVFAPFAPKDGAPDPCKFSEDSSRAGSPVTAVEATVPSNGRPHGSIIAELRTRVSQQGYRVTVRETRECGHSNCGVEVVVPWTHALEVPPGWYKDTTCGKHQYRTCSHCQSIYIMSSVNAAGQAPSVRCEVCNEVLVEWGSSKVWHAQLVTKGAATA